MKLLTLALILLLSTFTYAAQAEHQEKAQQPEGIYYGTILEVKGAMGYKYLKINEEGKELWIAIANAPVVVGDMIGYDKRTMMQDFKSKSLNQTFKAIFFASDVYLPKKAQKPQSMKDMLGLNSKQQDPHAKIGKGIMPEKEENPATPFVQKETYTIEEIHMWRHSLEGQNISIEGTVHKVSQQIMKLDWVHLGDGTGDKMKLTDDLVFTAATTTIKDGDKVIASGKVVVDKDFGYGYFYKVIIQDASFQVK